MTPPLNWVGDKFKDARCPECGEDVVLLSSVRRSLCMVEGGKILATIKDEEWEGVHCTNCCGFENQDPPEGVENAETARDNMDPLTIPYMAIGAHEALREAGDSQRVHKLADIHGGQMGIIAAVCKLAEELENITRDHDLETKGCWAYDVAELFGHAVVKWALDNGRAITEGGVPLVRNIIEDILAEEDPIS